MNSKRKLIFTAIFTLAALIAVARAGFAERWEENWVKDFFFGATIFAVQLVVFTVVLIMGQKRTPLYSSFMAFCKKIAENRRLQILIGGLLLSVNAGINVGWALGALFILGPLVFVGLMILNFVFAVSPRDSKWLSNPKLIYYMFILLITAPIGVIVYHYAIQWPWLDKLYSYKMIIDSAFNFTITIKPAALPHHFFKQILIYSIALYIPWVMGLATNRIYHYFSSLFAKKRIN
ncbi:MAG: hypothetical protein K2N34_01430 [Lachnospiraceae bacterium]|nr:hypothetical protein [Lachnospiraceae bacterium]